MLELEAFKTLQSEFKKPMFLTYFTRDHQLYIKLNSRKESSHSAVIYHVQQEYTHEDLTKPPPHTMIKPVLFLSRCLTATEHNYWPTELEVSCMVWVIQKVQYLINACTPDLPTVIYTDHSAMVQISKQSTLNSSSIDQLNLCLIHTSQYIQQFWIQCHHKPGKNNLITDMLSQLLTVDIEISMEQDLDALCMDTDPSNRRINNMDNTISPVDEPVLATVELSPEFKHYIIAGYTSDTKASLIITTLSNVSEDNHNAYMPYYIKDGLLYQQQVTPDGENNQLYIPQALAHNIFETIYDKSGHQGFEYFLASLNSFAVYKGTHLLQQYIQHCPHCQRNCTCHHLPYRILQPILSPAVPYHTIILDFILGLPCLANSNNCVLTITNKYTKQIGLIPEKMTWSAID